MSAGESAYDVARRQREKAARLERSAAKWEQGAAGEVAVANALAELPTGWTVLHDLAWPGRSRANIDHVAIGPGGIFVIDAKNWTGSVEVRDQVLRQNGRAREGAVISAAEAAIVLQGIVPEPQLCMGVLCFVRDEAMTGWARDVMVCTTANLAAMLTSRPTVLAPDAVQRCASAIRGATSSRAGTARTAQSRRSATPVTRASYSRGGRTPWVKLAFAVVLMAALMSGGYQVATDWAATRLTDVIVDDAPSTPPSKKPAEQKRQQQDEKAEQQQRG